MFDMPDEMFEDEERPRHTSTPTQQKPESRPAAKQVQLNSTMQAHLDKARAYQKQINDLIKVTDGQSRIRLQELATEVSTWVKAIEDLAKRVGNFQQNSLVQQDLQSVPQAIEKLEARLANESDETTRRELERTLASRKNQLAALEQLQNTISQAEIKIENTLSALGTIYSQVLTTQSTNQVADYSRLAAEADEEVRTLQDYLEALKEVKLDSM
jgi:predicted  nucleic acid-binding Zn-ribbon protein